MFVDASAIVAILTREPEADSLADLLEAAPSPITSPIARASENPTDSDHCEGGGYGACRVLPLWQGAGASRAAQPRRLFCLCGGEEPPDVTVVQGRGFQ